MDMFGAKEHDVRHDTVEQERRGLAEHVAQLTIGLGGARVHIDKAGRQEPATDE
jgi:hypothetical protein